MADDRTTVTELVTGLGTLSFDDITAAVAARPGQLALDDAMWGRLAGLVDDGRFSAASATAWANGRALLCADDGLRGRSPRLIEWTGGRRPPGDEVAPIDLRIDHVFLVSCKYLSRNIANPSPARLFDGLLATTGTWDRTDWYDAVAPAEYRHLYRACVAAAGLHDLPDDPRGLTRAERRRLQQALAERGYPDPDATAAYSELCQQVSVRSARRWRDRLDTLAQRERQLWRLLRIGNAAYYLLGADQHRALRLRVASAWDWKQAYRLVELDVQAASAGQPQVNWSAEFVDLAAATRRTVSGHVEVRWSHGRFAQPPEAKIYLDTPPDELPGYYPLDRAGERGADAAGGAAGGQLELWERPDI